jgi:hypothetical protein
MVAKEKERCDEERREHEPGNSGRGSGPQLAPHSTERQRLFEILCHQTTQPYRRRETQHR